MTTQLEAILERTDRLAQQVIDEWNRNASGNFSTEFEALLHKTFLYITAKRTLEKHRAYDALTERDEHEFQAARMNFCSCVLRILRRQAAGRFLLN